MGYMGNTCKRLNIIENLHKKIGQPNSQSYSTPGVEKLKQTSLRFCGKITPMKAVQFNQYGGPEVLEVNPNAPEPVASADQILVEVYAASINPFDILVISGARKEKFPIQFPSVPGGDFAGVIRGTGDEVYGQALFVQSNSGSFAEVLAVNREKIAARPKTVSFEEAAALPLVGASAIQALEDHIKLQSGQKILIHGGAGGIGHVAIQLAKALGAYVATTVNTDDVEFARGLGADEVIDYKTQKFEEKLRDFDAVYDTVGQETTDKSFQVLKKGGILVSMLGQPNPDLTEKYGVTAIGQGTKVDTDKLTRLARFVDDGKIKVHIDKVFALEQVKEAFTLQASYPRGKVVLRIKE